MATVCFTGHRPKDLFGYEEDSRALYSAVCERIKRECESLIGAGVNTFISGGAQGIDQLAFWAVEHLKREGFDIQNQLYKPFEGQERRWAKDDMFGQAEYRHMCECADLIHVSGDGTNAISDLMKRNEDMIDASDILFAVWNKSDLKPGEGKGGTAAACRYAAKKGCRVIVLNIAGYKTAADIQNSTASWYA